MISFNQLEIIENRITRLENLVGDFENIEQTKGFETINEIINRLSFFSSNYAKIGSAFKSINEINKYSNFDPINDLDDEIMLKAKIDLILSEKETIIKLDRDFKMLKSLKEILDNPIINEIPNLTEKLQKLCSKQTYSKGNNDEQIEQLKIFLSIYYKSMKSVNDSFINYDEFLSQYEQKQE